VEADLERVQVADSRVDGVDHLVDVLGRDLVGPADPLDCEVKPLGRDGVQAGHGSERFLVRTG
jgi:hypothetical protein